MPTLADLLTDPIRGRDLAPEQAAGLLVALAAIQASLLAQVVAHAPKDAGAETGPPPDRLLTVEELAKMLGVERRWIYRHADDFPFTKRLSRRAMRFRESGVRRWMAAKRG
jgi:excisionase family DNA binding protein